MLKVGNIAEGTFSLDNSGKYNSEICSHETGVNFASATTCPRQFNQVLLISATMTWTLKIRKTFDYHHLQ